MMEHRPLENLAATSARSRASNSCCSRRILATLLVQKLAFFFSFCERHIQTFARTNQHAPIETKRWNLERVVTCMSSRRDES